MDKQEFFIQFTKELSDKYQIPQKQVETIRSSILGYKYTKEKLLALLINKIPQPCRRHKRARANSRSHSKVYYQSLYNFIVGCNPKDWEYITQKTKFDK